MRYDDARDTPPEDVAAALEEPLLADIEHLRNRRWIGKGFIYTDARGVTRYVDSRRNFKVIRTPPAISKADSPPVRKPATPDPSHS